MCLEHKAHEENDCSNHINHNEMKLSLDLSTTRCIGLYIVLATEHQFFDPQPMWFIDLLKTDFSTNYKGSLLSY